MSGDGADPVISGVSLAQYAAVTAALTQAFPLKAVLTVEGLDATRWAAADRGWTDRLDKDTGLLARYQAELAAAEDRLSRSVEPIDNDLGAWVAFLAALGRAPNPDDMLAQLGIGPDDVSRLRRRWDARMKEDPTLGKRAAELQRQDPGKLPRLRVVKGKLTRTGGAVAPAAASPPAAIAPPAIAPPPMPRPVVPPARQAPPAPPIANEETAPPLPARRRSKDDDGTLVNYERPGTTLPFQATPSRAFLDAMDRPAAAPGQGSDGATVALRGAAALRALELRDDGPPDPEGESLNTVAIVSPFTAAALPFGPSPGDAEPPPRSEPAPERTMMIQAPLRPAAPSREDATQFYTPPVPEHGPPGATMTGMRSPFARKALPFDGPDGGDRAPRPPEARAAGKLPGVPQVRTPGQTSHRRTLQGLAALPPEVEPVEEPPLSLERHASLCLELALDPAHAGEVMARYQVSAAVKQRADDFYRARLAADPELRAQWNRAFEIYRVWFTSQQRP